MDGTIVTLTALRCTADGKPPETVRFDHGDSYSKKYFSNRTPLKQPAQFYPESPLAPAQTASTDAISPTLLPSDLTMTPPTRWSVNNFIEISEVP